MQVTVFLHGNDSPLRQSVEDVMKLVVVIKTFPPPADDLASIVYLLNPSPYLEYLITYQVSLFRSVYFLIKRC
jgi:hypothetical protein